MSMIRKYNFTGIYTPQSGLGQDESSVAVYALNKQGLIAPLNPSTEVGAQRWYLTVSNRNSSNMSQASKSRSISIDEVGEGATTAIKGIQVITNNEADNTSLMVYMTCKVVSSAKSLLMASISKWQKYVK